MNLPIGTDAGKLGGSRCPMLVYAVLAGSLAGILWGIEPPELSRWHEYEAIRLWMPQQEAVNLVENSSPGYAGCGTLHYEGRDSVCRFEDPWRGYIINFNPDTKLVSRKRFYFKRVPGLNFFSRRFR
jgi:hypothetical protein